MIGLGTGGSVGRRNRRNSAHTGIRAIVIPASSELRVGERLSDTVNWSIFQNPQNYLPSGPGQSIASVVVSYIGSTTSATEVFEDGDQNSFSVAVTDTSAAVRTFPVVPRTVVHIAPSVSGPLQDQSFRIATGLQIYETAGAFAGEALAFAVSAPAGVSIDPVTGTLTFDTHQLSEQTGTQITVTALNSGGSAEITFGFEITPAITYVADITGLIDNPLFGATAEIGRPLTGVVSGLQAGDIVAHRWRDTDSIIPGATDSSFVPGSAQDLKALHYTPLINGEAIASEGFIVRHAPPVAGTPAPITATQGSGPVVVDLQSVFSGEQLTYSAAAAWASVSGSLLVIDDTARSDNVTVIATNSGGSASVDLSVTITAAAVSVINPIPDQTITQDAGDITIDLRTVFQNATSHAVSGAGASIDGDGFTLRLDDGTPQPGVTITVTGANGFSSADDAFTLIVSGVQTAPAQMQPPLVIADSPTRVSVTFAPAPSDGGSAITQYDLRYRSNGGTWTTQPDVTDPVILDVFSENTSVDVQTRARNAIGIGSWSASGSVTTPLAAPGVSQALAHQIFAQASGVQTFDSSGGFTGSNLSFSVNSVTGVTINSVTGVLSFDTDVMALQTGTSVIVTATNSGGSADSGFSLSITAVTSVSVVNDGDEPIATIPDGSTAPLIHVIQTGPQTGSYTQTVASSLGPAETLTGVLIENNVAVPFTNPTPAGATTLGGTVSCEPPLYLRDISKPYPGDATFQWQSDGLDVSGATDTSVTVTVATGGTGLRMLTTFGGVTVTSAVLPIPAIAVPDAFADADWSVATGAGVGELDITIASLPADNNAAITDIEYDVNANGTWISLGTAAAGTVTVTMPAPATSCAIRLRAVNGVGNAAAGNSESATSGAGALSGMEALFSGGEQGGYIDISDLSTLWQDPAGTVPVTTDGQTVARVDIKGGPSNYFVQATPGNRPTYKTNGTQHWLEFNNSQWMETSSPVDFSGSDAADFGLAVTVDTGNTDVLLELTATHWSTANSWLLISQTNYKASSRGDAAADSSIEATVTVSAPETITLVAHTDISDDLSRIWKDGVQGTDAVGDKGAGNLSSAKVYMGARSGGSFALSGDIFGAFFIDRALTTDERTNDVQPFLDGLRP